MFRAFLKPKVNHRYMPDVVKVDREFIGLNKVLYSYVGSQPVTNPSEP